MGRDRPYQDRLHAIRRNDQAPQEEEEQFLRTLLGSTSDIVVVLDAEGIIRYENSAVERILGYRPEERIGTSAFDHVHEDDVEKVREEFARALASPGVHPPIRFRLRHADGSWRHIETVRNNLLDEPMIRGIVNVSRDVTDHEETLETLRKSRAQFRAVFDRSAVGMALVDAEGRIMESNAALQEMLGYGGEELREMSFKDVTHPEDVSADVEFFKKMIAGELDPFRLEKRYIRKDGRLIWGHLTGSVIHGDKERPRLMVGMVEDITERRRAEKRVQASEAGMKALFAAMHDLVLMLDRDGRCLRVASANPSLLYRSAEEQTGKTLHEILPSEKADLLLDRVHRTLETRRTVSVEYSLPMDDGERWFSANVSPMSEDRVAWVARDVTGWKEMETALRESEERYRAVMEQSVEAIYLYDAGTKQVIESNATFQQMIGYTTEELRGMKVYDFIAHDPEDVDRHIGRSLREKRRHIGERTYRRKDGTDIIVDTSATVISYGGRTALCAVSRDITERKRLEEALREREEYFRALIQNAPDLIMILDAESTILYDSPSIERVLGYAPGERVGEKGLDYVHPADLERVRRTFDEALGNPGVGRPVEYRLRHADGSWRHFEAVRTNLLDNPAVGGVVINLRDVTERRRAEKELRESEERHRRLVEDSPETIAILSEGKIAFINPAGARLVGADGPEQMVGRSFLDFVHPDSRESVQRRVTRALGGETTELMQQKLLRLDGSVIDVEAVTIPTVYAGEPAAHSIIRDVTERLRAEEQLRASEERFRHLFERSTDALLVHDEHGRMVDCNEEACRSLGYSREELLELYVRDFATDVLSEDEKRARKGDTPWARALSAEPGVVVEFHENEHRRKDDTTFPVEVGIGAIDYGGRRLIVASARDLTERKQAEEELRESEERYRAVVEQSIESIYLFDPGTKRILESNAAFQQLLGYTPEELSWMAVYDIVAHEREDIDLNVERHLMEGQRFVGKRRYRRKDGSLIDVEVSASVIPYGDGQAICAVVRNVTEQKALEKQLTHRAFHDPLTELPNRALFLDRLDHALSKVRREDGSVAVLFVDLDDFKSINDSLGHEAGNRLLGEVGRRLQSCVRPGDTIARLFGDEFGVLLDAPVEVEEARRVTERIMERLRAPFSLDGREVFVNSSIGIASGPDSDDPERERPKDVLRRADLAMYAAKTGGKGRYEIFHPSMNTRAIERMELNTHLRRAVERGEFEVHYQPIVESESGGVAGLEALVRWRHPEQGLVAAEEFIELAEDTGLIHPIGEVVFEQVCLQAQRWIEDSQIPPLLISVNYSASQFINQADMISKVLSETGLDPGALVVEITERAVMDNAEFALGKLRRLKGLGVRFAIDDYGTGYSCLRYLKLMPVDFLKIDRMFIAGLGKDPGDTAIVHGTIDLAHALGLKVVAEGVESAEQHERLKDLGCDMVQGYRFSWPLSASEASYLLEKNPTRLPG